jgi:hypothetical protein
MGYKNREIESKLVVKQKPGGPVANTRNVDRVLERAFEDETKDYVEGTSNDTYWEAPSGAPADFGRVREMSSGRCMLTAKGKDKGDNLDRIEVDLDVHGTPIQVVKFMENLLGVSGGTIRKTYGVYVLENEHTTVSLYRVHGDDRVFVEVEARTKKRMLQMEDKVKRHLLESGFDSERVEKSLFEMFIAKKEAR